MLFQLNGPWPVGQWLVPDGTIIDGNAPAFNGVPLPMPLPLNAKALDQEAYDVMARWYSESIHLLQFADGVQPKKG